MGDYKNAHRNEFVREYTDKAFKINWNKKTYEGKNGLVHDEAVNRVCYALNKKGYDFATEVRLKGGRIADVIAPNGTFQVIEVLNSETEKMVRDKLSHFPGDLAQKTVYESASRINSFSEKELLDWVICP